MKTSRLSVRICAFLLIFLPNSWSFDQQSSVSLDHDDVQSVIQAVRDEFPRFRYVILWHDDLRPNAFNLSDHLIGVTKALITSAGMTEDILTLVMLHEVGHTFGDGPHYPNGTACEDVADAWAASDGLIKMWGYPQSRKAKIKFRKRGEAAIKMLSDLLASWEIRDENIYRYIQQENSIIINNAPNCGHSPPELRRKNMILALMKAIDI